VCVNMTVEFQIHEHLFNVSLLDFLACFSIPCVEHIDCKKYGQSFCDVTHRLSEEKF